MWVNKKGASAPFFVGDIISCNFKDINRPYNRVHNDANKLEAIWLLKAVSAKQAGRAVMLLTAA